MLGSLDLIERLRKEYKDIPYDIWEIERKKRFDNLYKVVQEKIPKAWESIELAITANTDTTLKAAKWYLIHNIRFVHHSYSILGISLEASK